MNYLTECYSAFQFQLTIAGFGEEFLNKGKLNV
jgi:hypothetical protein